MNGRLFLSLAIVLLLAEPASAHSRSESYSHWRQSGNRLTLSVTMPVREVTRLPEFTGAPNSAAETLRLHLQSRTSISSASGPCSSGAARTLPAAAGFARIEKDFDCHEERPETLHYRVLFDVAPSHVHYSKYYVDGELRAEFLLTDSIDAWSIDNSAAMPVETHSFRDFVGIGISHIAGGPDHIAFLLGLLLVAGSLRNGIIAVTGFTLGHSASLVAAVLGYAHADGPLVEALIGFTVGLVAVEYFVLRHQQPDVIALAVVCTAWVTGTVALIAGAIPARSITTYLGVGVFAYCYLMLAPRMRAQGKGNVLFVATACFGLIHGFGFAGFLMQTGILGNSLVRPLFGFNIGVELGQILLILIVLAIARSAARLTPAAAPQALAAGLCAVGVFWFIGRTLGV